MPNRYYNKATGTEVLDNVAVPVPSRYDSENPDHVILPDTNAFFSALPIGMEIEFSLDNVPIGLIAIPDYLINSSKGNKVSEIQQEFLTRSEADGIAMSLSEARSNLAAFGEASVPNAGQVRFYANIPAADAGIATVNGYVNLFDVDSFDVPSDVAWSV